MALFLRPARVRPYFGYRSADRLVLTARALRMRDPRWERTRTLGKLTAMLRQFASVEVPGLEVTLELGGEDIAPITVTRTSDREGYLRFEATFPARRELPVDPEWEVARLSWTSRGGPQTAEAYVLAPGRSGRLGVISDIDDTIIETGATDLLRNWRRLVAQMPGERVAVPGAVEFFHDLGGGHFGEHVPASRRPFFYVSSSPWNLFDYLVAFQKAQNLPQGPLLLRDWAFNRATFSSHGSHKAAAIRHLSEFYPDLRFVLIGDDTQADALAFAEAVTAHPGRIAAVFIRRTPESTVGPEEQAALDAIGDAGVPLWLGESWKVGADFLDSLGFAPAGETTAIVATIEAAKEGPRT